MKLKHSFLLLIILLTVQCVHQPPQEKREFRPAELVELINLDPTLHLDIRYATSNNFMGRPMYQEARAFLQRPAAEALVRAHSKLKPQGYGLLIFDGYRPWSITKLFW
ncbi:MAG TPA: M15 family metallopeptidase, partial [Acidobacteriota bacterium]|nr:M15 family metallopeptidase [Acidobacteriota bacterium]